MRLGGLKAMWPLARLSLNLGRLPETKRDRLVQVLYGVWQLLWSFRAPRHRVLVVGKGLLYLSGEVILTSHGVTRKAVRTLAAGQPILMLRSKSDSGLRELCAAITIDEVESLRTIFSTNPVSVFFARRAGTPLVVHAALRNTGGGVSSQLADLQLARDLVPSAMRAIMPMVVERVTTVNADVLIQTHLSGESRLGRDTSERELQQNMLTALAPLRTLYQDGRRAQVAPDQAHIDNALPALLRRWPHHAPELSASISALRNWSRHHLPSVLVHGDYWLGNILFDGEPPQITGILDWDCVRPNGCPGYDALHLVFATLAMQRQHLAARYLEQVWTKKWSSDLVPRMLGEIQRTFHLAPLDVEYLAALLWLTLLWQRNVQRDANWQEDMIQRPANSFLRWHAELGAAAPTSNSDFYV